MIKIIENPLRQRKETVLTRFKTKVVIFDLDGTLLDNNPYHLKSWFEYLKIQGRNI